MFQILTRFSKFQLKLAYKLNKPFQVIWGPIQAQDGMGEVNQWSCGCVVSNFECPIFRMKQIIIFKWDSVAHNIFLPLWQSKYCVKMCLWTTHTCDVEKMNHT